MATSSAVSAVIRAYRVQFSSGPDKLAFCIHAILSTNDFKLLAVGAAADAAGEDVRSRQEECSLDGWNTTGSPENGGTYTFLYALQNPHDSSLKAGSGGTAAPTCLLVKAINAGPQLLVSFMLDPCPEGKAPETIELDVDQYVGATPETTTSYTYSNLDQLITRTQTALSTQVSSYVAATSGVGKTASTDAGKTGSAGEVRSAEDDDPLRDYSQPSRAAGGRIPMQPRNPLMVGEDDFGPGVSFPGGGRHTFDPLEGAVGGRHGGGIGPGGGMHMGPGHPAFGGMGGGFPIPGRPGPGGGVGPWPGIRWDPINPAGVPGFLPDDFTRGGRGRGGLPPGYIHPDVMQPGRGSPGPMARGARGAGVFDHMFG